MAGVREFYDPDAIMRVAPDWPEPGPFVGRDAVMQQLSEAGALSTRIGRRSWATLSPRATGSLCE